MRARDDLVVRNEAAPILVAVDLPGGTDDASDVRIEGGNDTALPSALGAGQQAAIQLRDRQVRGAKQLLRAIPDDPARDRATRVFLGEGMESREVPGPLLRAILGIA